MSPVKNVVWFVADEDASIAARLALEKAGGNVKAHYSDISKMTYFVGETDNKSICIYPIDRANSIEVIQLTARANRVFLTGSIVGRRNKVNLADVILVDGCYQIDLGLQLNSTQISDFQGKQRVKCDELMPLALHTRVDQVFSRLLKTDEAITLKQLFCLAVDKGADIEIQYHQWKKIQLWLQENNFIAIKNIRKDLFFEDGDVTLTKKGREYCEKSPPKASEEQPSFYSSIQRGSIITSPHSQPDLEEAENWKQYDRPNFIPLGFDRDSYKMLKRYPQITILKAVIHFGKSDKYDRKALIHKVAALACLSLIKTI